MSGGACCAACARRGAVVVRGADDAAQVDAIVGVLGGRAGSGRGGAINPNDPGAREGRMVDDMLSGLLGAVAPIIPVPGVARVITSANDVRREAMWGRDARSDARAPAAPRGPARGAPTRGNAVVKMVQRTVRMASAGDPGASRTLSLWKGAAASSPAMAKRWAAAVAVMRDDDRRIDARFRASLPARSSSSRRTATAAR